MKYIFSEAYLICTIINNLSILCIVYVLARGYFYKKVNLSIGSFKIKRKDFTVQNITNIVSMQFYNGGDVPANVRKEILLVTCPKVSALTRYKPASNKSKHRKHYRKPQNNRENLSKKN